MGHVVTIDGPSASGKTTVSRELARRLGWQWLSTGILYRGLGYLAQKLQVDLSSEMDLVNLAQSPLWRMELGTERTSFFFKDQDLTQDLAAEFCGMLASQVGQFPKVRKELLKPQRQFQNNTENLIVEGRDCGSVVFPDADLKFYITAGAQERAQRRSLENSGSHATTAGIRHLQNLRDNKDATRPSAPLVVPEGAIILDTSHMDLETTLQFLQGELKKYGLATHPHHVPS